MEWLFLTCHNYWVVCRLVKDDEHPFLAYSSMISIKDSSQPFRAFLGAILSEMKGVSVEPSTFDPDMELDTIVEEEYEDPGPLSEGDTGNSSGAYRDSSSKGTATKPPLTRKRARDEGNESGLMVRFMHCHRHVDSLIHSDYFVFHEIASILPSVGTSLYLSEQHSRPSAVLREQETTPVVNSLCRIWVDWQRLGVSF
jgi:hypothetical protein